jgi:hypothetical protein
MSRRQIKVTAEKFEELYQSAKQPVIELDDVNAYLTIGALEYVTPRRDQVSA